MIKGSKHPYISKYSLGGYDNGLWWYNYLINCGKCWTELHLWRAALARSTRSPVQETLVWLSPLRLNYPNARFRSSSTPRGSWVIKIRCSRLKMPSRHSQSPRKLLKLRPLPKIPQGQPPSQCSPNTDLSQRALSRQDSVIGRSKENALIFELSSMRLVVIKWVLNITANVDSCSQWNSCCFPDSPCWPEGFCKASYQSDLMEKSLWDRGVERGPGHSLKGKGFWPNIWGMDLFYTAERSL